MASVMILEFLTDILLLLSVQHLCRCRGRPVQFLCSALAGGMYVGACLMWPALAHPLLRLASRAVLCLAAFGIHKDLWRQQILFIGLNTAMECIATGDAENLFPLGLCVIAVGLLQARSGEGALLPVELRYQQKTVKITALQDTGNTLRDPVTGKRVLVVGSDVANTLLGLSPEDLCLPLQTILKIPGLRLIPYKTVGGSGFLLAIKLNQVSIGNYKGSHLVAFAPENIGNGNYQALTGGMV